MPRARRTQHCSGLLFARGADAAEVERDGGSASIRHRRASIDSDRHAVSIRRIHVPRVVLTAAAWLDMSSNRWATPQLPRRSEDIGKLGEPITRSQLEPGDLVFFNTLARAYSHVAIYIGEGRFLHAPARDGRVRIEGLDDRYWRGRFDGARRLHRRRCADSARGLDVVPSPLSGPFFPVVPDRMNTVVEIIKIRDVAKSGFG